MWSGDVTVIIETVQAIDSAAIKWQTGPEQLNNEGKSLELCISSVLTADSVTTADNYSLLMEGMWHILLFAFGVFMQ